MALNPRRGFGTEDIGDLTAPLYFSDVMTAAVYAENTLLPHIKKGEEIDQVTMHWVEDLINPFQVSVPAGATAAATNITLGSGQGRMVRKGSLLKTTTLSGLVEELLQVINPPVGDSVDVSRGYGGTTAVVIAAAESLTLIGNPLEENSGLQADLTKARRGLLNYCQVFEKSVELSRRQMKRKMVAVSNEFIKSIKDRTIEAKRELENSIIYSRAKAADPAGDYSTMRGMLDLLTDSSVPASFIKDAGAAALTDALLNAQIATVYQNGGKLDIIYAPQFQARQFASPNFFGGGSATGIRWTASDRVRGAYVRQFLSDVGAVLDVVSSPFLRKDAVALLNSELLSMHAYAESDWFMIQAPTLFDGKATRLVGDYTFKLQHAGETHLLIRNLATS
jgi:hypothetical protein